MVGVVCDHHSLVGPIVGVPVASLGRRVEGPIPHYDSFFLVRALSPQIQCLGGGYTTVLGADWRHAIGHTGSGGDHLVRSDYNQHHVVIAREVCGISDTDRGKVG